MGNDVSAPGGSHGIRQIVPIFFSQTRFERIHERLGIMLYHKTLPNFLRTRFTAGQRYCLGQLSRADQFELCPDTLRAFATVEP